MIVLGKVHDELGAVLDFLGMEVHVIQLGTNPAAKMQSDRGILAFDFCTMTVIDEIGRLLLADRSKAAGRILACTLSHIKK